MDLHDTILCSQRYSTETIESIVDHPDYRVFIVKHDCVIEKAVIETENNDTKNLTYTCQKQKHWNPYKRDKVEGKKDDELCDLSEREWRVDCGYSRLPQTFYWSTFFRVYHSGGRDQMFMALVNENSVKDIH